VADKSAEEEVDEDDEFKPSPRRIGHPPPQLSRTHMSRLRNAFLTVPEAAYIAGVSPAGHVALAEDAGFHHVLVLAGLGVIAEIRIILVGQLANYDRWRPSDGWIFHRDRARRDFAEGGRRLRRGRSAKVCG